LTYRGLLEACDYTSRWQPHSDPSQLRFASQPLGRLSVGYCPKTGAD
jgi:hypothetical protein